MVTGSQDNSEISQRYFQFAGRVVGIATGYVLDGPGIESRCGRDFPHLSRPALGPIQSPVQWVKSGGGVKLTPHSFQCRGQERVELYLNSPYGPYGLYRASVPVQGCTLSLHLHLLPVLYVNPYPTNVENRMSS